MPTTKNEDDDEEDSGMGSSLPFLRVLRFPRVLRASSSSSSSQRRTGDHLHLKPFPELSAAGIEVIKQ
jgi:hypothetical protein